MAESIEEEDAENLCNPPSKNDTGVNVPLKEPETVSQNLETKPMEVHHHPHVEKKNFKEYFLGIPNDISRGNNGLFCRKSCRETY